MNEYFVYILKCRGSSYYTGITNNLYRRLEEHSLGLDKSAYTFSRRPVELMFFEKFISPDSAISYEKKNKGWSRKKKEALITSSWDELHEYSKCNNETSHLKRK